MGLYTLVQVTSSKKCRKRGLYALSSAESDQQGGADAAGTPQAARDACRHICDFLAFVLSDDLTISAHPLLSMQCFLLADLEATCGNASGARDAIEQCVRGLRVTHGAEGGALLERAEARLAEL